LLIELNHQLTHTKTCLIADVSGLVHYCRKHHGPRILFYFNVSNFSNVSNVSSVSFC